VIVLGGVLGNVGAVPSASLSPPVYDAIFRVVAPVSIFLLLLDVRLSALRRAGGPMLVAFILGAMGTTLGALAAVQLTNVHDVLGERAGPLSGMFTGTYVGGSANFNAIALHFGVVRDGVVFAGATAVDAILGTIFIIVILALPSIIRRLGFSKRAEEEVERASVSIPPTSESEVPATVSSSASILALSLLALFASERLAEVLSSTGVEVPSILILTTLALLVAQSARVQALGGARMLGQLAVYLFLTVIGVHCELASVAKLGEIGPTLMMFVTIVLIVHTLVLVGGGLLLRLEPEVIAMGSNANVMGASTAPAVAESVGRHDLILPGILAGSLGTAVGTYLGFAVAAVV
jgi:uncharacterized membrane protein